MTIDTEKQFAGNYIRLVNQVRELQGELTLKNKMVEIIKQKLAEGFSNDRYTYSANSLFITDMINKSKQQALSELVAEQNKKAASGESI